MDNTIIIVLGIILLILIILNHITIIKTTTTKQANCAQTAFGCCPDGVNSKVNFYGTNCPGYRPGPRPRPPKPIGGCSGTRYGCCPNNQTPKIDAQGSNCLVK